LKYIFFIFLIISNLFCGVEESVLEVANSIKKFANTRKIPNKVFTSSYAVVIIPNYTKASFFVGGHFGEGMAIVKKDDGTWSNPFFVKVAGGSLGIQFGFESNDTIFLFRNKKSLNELLEHKITLGTEVSVSIGPIEENYNAYKEANFQADVLTYHIKGGLFAGASFDGTVISHDKEKNSVIYGNDSQVSNIVNKEIKTDIYALQELHKNLDRYK
jgi:lipid-binding SYLF domain-containing protein